MHHFAKNTCWRNVGCGIQQSLCDQLLRFDQFFSELKHTLIHFGANLALIPCGDIATHD